MQSRKHQCIERSTDSVSFNGQGTAVKKSLTHNIKSFIQKLKQNSARIESPIKLPKAENFDELISRLEQEGKKYEVIPESSKSYKRVKIYTKSQETPQLEYSFRKKGSLYDISKNNSKGETIKEYIYRSSGAPKEVVLYNPEVKRTRGYIEFNRSDVKFVKLNPHTNKYFEEVEIVKYKKDGTWENFHPDTYEKLGQYSTHPSRVQK